jgi:hypothetical protein
MAINKINQLTKTINTSQQVELGGVTPSESPRPIRTGIPVYILRKYFIVNK